MTRPLHELPVARIVFPRLAQDQAIQSPIRIGNAFIKSPLSGEFLANDSCWGRGVNFLQVLGHQESTHAPVDGLIPVYIQEAVKSEAQFFLFIYFFLQSK